MVFVKGDTCYTRSAAALEVAYLLCFPWWTLYSFSIIPSPILDVFYNL
eukprot:CAMPEP_0174263016 /NCGR_PEP_ID=MMETSP0439-20130205/16795_1 /TAXON_ID=0 /ORGANISM="Stereomyxa ramosa, Strain Chinc5" /LENGTH=47 /DNA_ID= /DNA_START= /DNA_END= /DNA_ORIENTATION=